MQAPPDALDIVDGEVIRKDQPRGPSMTLGEIARASRADLEDARRPRARAVGRRLVPHRASGLSLRHPPRGGEGRSRHRRRRRSSATSSPTTSAAPSIRRWSKGQIVGGFAQGLGGALLRGVHLQRARRSAGRRPSPTTCCRPCARCPRSRSCCARTTPSPLNPLGIKGAGESGVTGVGAAIASAIDDAIGIPGAVTQLPVTPQRMRQMLNGRR